MIVKDYRSMNMASSASLNIEQSKKIARDNGLTLILTGSVSIFGGKYSIDAQIWALNEQKPRFSHSLTASSENDVIPKIDEMSQAIQKVICKERFAPENTRDERETIGAFTYQIFPELNIAINSITVADINQDNFPELVAADDHSVYMFDFATDSLHMMGYYNADRTHRIIWLDAADIDNDQKPEFYVTAIHKLSRRLVSFILTWDKDAFQVRLQDEPFYFRCFRRHDQTVHLIGQKQTLENLFSKKICMLQYYNNKLIVDKTQFIPPNSHFASFHQGQLTDSGKSYVIIRDNNRMEILDASFRSKWLSQTLYAESKKILFFPKDSSRKAPHENEKFLYLNQRILVDDVDQDHMDEIIVSKQHASSGSRLFQRYRHFDSGIITCLKWNGMHMVPLWKTPEINGYISDYIWFDRTGKKNMCVAVSAISEKSLFKSASSQIILFTLIK
jgi:hypothetical protein